MHFIKPHLTAEDVPDGTYTVESVYPTKKITSRQTVEIKNSRVYPEGQVYSLSLDDFFHDHVIIPSPRKR